MNRLINAIAIVFALSIVQGCTQLSQQKEQLPVMATAHQDTHEKSTEKSTHGHSVTSVASHASSENNQANAAAFTQAKLNAPAAISSKTPTLLNIDIQDRDGNPILQFDRFQEQVMHLIVASDNLQVFQHLHPTYRRNGRFEVKVQFPQPGRYTLFSDYRPTGQAEQVSVLKTQVVGSPAPAAQSDWSHTKTFDQTVVDFTPTPTAIKAGEAAILQFDLQDLVSNQPVTDLQPYLGEKGHLVILRQSPALAQEDYIHAHAVHDTPVNQVHFATRFPRPGKYKLWGQFNRNGEIITADFWVEVAQ